MKQQNTVPLLGKYVSGFCSEQGTGRRGASTREEGNMAQSGKKEANMVTLFFANVLYWACAGVYSPFLSETSGKP